MSSIPNGFLDSHRHEHFYKMCMDLARLLKDPKFTRLLPWTRTDGAVIFLPPEDLRPIFSKFGHNIIISFVEESKRRGDLSTISTLKILEYFSALVKEAVEGIDLNNLTVSETGNTVDLNFGEMSVVAGEGVAGWNEVALKNIVFNQLIVAIANCFKFLANNPEDQPHVLDCSKLVAHLPTLNEILKDIQKTSRSKAIGTLPVGSSYFETNIPGADPVKIALDRIAFDIVIIGTKVRTLSPIYSDVLKAVFTEFTGQPYTALGIQDALAHTHTWRQFNFPPAEFHDRVIRKFNLLLEGKYMTQQELKSAQDERLQQMTRLLGVEPQYKIER